MRFFPRFFPKQIQKLIDVMNEKPLIYDETGKQIQVCSDLRLHNIRGRKCVWCGKLESELIQDKISDQLIPKIEIDSLTSATVNSPKPFINIPIVDDVIVESKPKSMDLSKVESYCLKCKARVIVMNPEYADEETRRGIRRILKGTCINCQSKIHAIVKRS